MAPVEYGGGQAQRFSDKTQSLFFTNSKSPEISRCNNKISENSRISKKFEIIQKQFLILEGLVHPITIT